MRASDPVKGESGPRGPDSREAEVRVESKAGYRIRDQGTAQGESMAIDRVKENIEVAKREFARLESRLRGLSAEDFNRESACDKWQVGDVVAHVVFVVQFQKNMTTRGLKGEADAPEGARRAAAADVPADVRIAQGAIRLREKLGDGLMDALRKNYQEGFELLDSLTPEDYEKPCWHPWRTMTVADFVDLVVNELAIHAWDAFSTLDPDYHMAPESLPGALAIGNMTLARMASTGPARFRFELTDGNDVPDLVVGGEAAPADVSATIRCDGEALVLISSGRLGMEDAMASGRVEVSGDEGLVRGLGGGLGGL